jgi:hypothetical protein
MYGDLEHLEVKLSPINQYTTSGDQTYYMIEESCDIIASAVSI